MARAMTMTDYDKQEQEYLFNTYGAVMSVKDVMEEMKIGKDKAYKLFNKDSFPKFIFDGRNCIETAKFAEWLNNCQYLPQGYMLCITNFN